MSLRDQIDDARYSARAWSQGVAWSAVFAGIGMTVMGLANKDTALFASGITAVVVAFIPRARSKVVYELARTVAMKRGWIDVPKEEKPLITREILIGPKGIRSKD